MEETHPSILLLLAQRGKREQRKGTKGGIAFSSLIILGSNGSLKNGGGVGSSEMKKEKEM